MELKTCEQKIEKMTLDDNLKWHKLHPEHPGVKYQCVEKKTFSEILIIYMQIFPDVKCLELNSPKDISSAEVIEIREEYALRSLLLFLPFTKKKA